MNERTNEYAGRCRVCGGIVEAGEGLLKKDGKRWVVECEPRYCGSYSKYMDTVHPFSSEGIGQDW